MTPTPNVAMLRQVLEHITAHPEQHNQRVLGVRTPCGTAHCVAGHAAVMTGHQIQWDDWDDDVQITTFVDSGLAVWDVAQEALGLTPGQAAVLFAAENPLRTLWALAEELSQGQIVSPGPGVFAAYDTVHPRILPAAEAGAA